MTLIAPGESQNRENVARYLEEQGAEVIRVGSPNNMTGVEHACQYYVDVAQQAIIRELIEKHHPFAIVNCVGKLVYDSGEDPDAGTIHEYEFKVKK